MILGKVATNDMKTEEKDATLGNCWNLELQTLC